MTDANDRARIGIVLKGYPRLSETFIAQEIREFERLGFRMDLISLRHPTDPAVHPVHREIVSPVHYLPEYLHDEPMRVLRAWRRARKLPGYRAAVKVFWRDFRRDPTRNRLRRFGQGLVIAAEHAGRCSFFYVHFIHTPASATRYASIVSGTAFAMSAHAKDIWTTPGWELREKLADCAWCVTCTRIGADELARHADDPAKVYLVYHGMDLERFPPSPAHETRDGSDPADPLQMITIGRAVPKKGIDTVIDALAGLPRELHWRWTHIGGGPLRDILIGRARRAGILERCDFRDARPQEEVLDAYRRSDLFVLPCRIDATGDRDGLPNVILEAQSQGLAVLTTPVSGACELITEGENGVLVEPEDPQALAAAIVKLASDPQWRLALGKRGNARVRQSFDHKTTNAALADLLERSIGEARREAAQ